MKLNSNISRIITGIVFTVTGLALSLPSLFQVEYSYQLPSYFSPAYLSQFIPPIIGVLLFLSGIYLLRKHAKTNFHFALFGHSATEEIIFSWIGLKTTQLSAFWVWSLFVIALFSLYLAYSNTFKFDKLSYKEAFYGILTGVVVSLLPDVIGAYRLY